MVFCIFIPIVSPVSFEINFRQCLNCWSRSRHPLTHCITVCAERERDGIPDRLYQSCYYRGLRSTKRWKKMVKWPVWRPWKCPLESDGQLTQTTHNSFNLPSEPVIDNFNQQLHTCSLTVWLSFSVLVHVLGTPPIKAPFDHCIFFFVPLLPGLELFAYSY